MENENTLNKIGVIATYELKINSRNFTVYIISNDISWDSSQKKSSEFCCHWGPQKLINISVLALHFSLQGLELQLEI